MENGDVDTNLAESDSKVQAQVSSSSTNKNLAKPNSKKTIELALDT